MIILEWLLATGRVVAIGMTAAMYVESIWIIRLYRQVEKTLSKEKVHLLPRHVWTVAIGLLGLATVNSLTILLALLRDEPPTPSLLALPFLGWALYSLRLVRRFELARLRSIQL